MDDKAGYALEWGYRDLLSVVFTHVACWLCADLGAEMTQLLHLSLGLFVFTQQD